MGIIVAFVFPVLVVCSVISMYTKVNHQPINPPVMIKRICGLPFHELNLFTAPACKISGLKSAPIHAYKQYILSDGPITSLLSVLCTLTEVLSRARAKMRKGLKMISSLAPLLVVSPRVTRWQAWQ